VQINCNHPTVAICFRVRTPSKTQGYHLLHLSSTPCHSWGYIKEGQGSLETVAMLNGGYFTLIPSTACSPKTK